MNQLQRRRIWVLLLLPLLFDSSGFAADPAQNPSDARLEECRAIIAADPDPDRAAGAWLEMGIILSFSPEHDRQEGIEAFQKIASEYPRCRWADDALWYMGKAYLFSLHDAEKAISAYQEALDKYGGVSFERLPGMVEHAARLLKGKPPDYLTASALKGEIKKLRKAWERTDALEAQIQNKSDPQKSVKLHFALAETRRSLANFPQAMKMYEQIIQRFPTQNEAAQARFEMGEVYSKNQVALFDDLHYPPLSDSLERSAYEEAVKRYQMVVDDYPESEWAAQAMYRIAECYLHLKEYAKAKKACESLISKYPGSPVTAKAKELYAKADSQYRSRLAIDEYSGAYAVVEQYCRAWQNKDYRVMYGLLSRERKEKESEEDFVKEYQDRKWSACRI